MKTLIILSLLISTMATSSYKIDFGTSKHGDEWVIVNDGVMGGQSESKARMLENSIIFEGFISLRNNGGFASLRNQGEKIDISEFSHVKIRFKTNTQRKFSFRLSAHNAFYRPFYKHEFGAKNNEWNTVIMKLTDFKQYNLSGETGRWLNSKEMLNDFRMGIILYDKQEGSFEIEIDIIEFY